MKNAVVKIALLTLWPLLAIIITASLVFILACAWIVILFCRVSIDENFKIDVSFKGRSILEPEKGAP